MATAPQPIASAPAGAVARAAGPRCTATLRHKFHLRTQETIRSEGTEYPAGTRVELIAQSELGRAGARLFQGRILTTGPGTGQTGYLFFGASELDANCPFDWEDDPRADRTSNQPQRPGGGRCVVNGPVATREKLVRPECPINSDSDKEPRVKVFAEIDLDHDGQKDQLLTEIDRTEAFYVATHTPAGWVAYLVGSGSGDADGPQVNWVTPVVTKDGGYAILSFRRDNDEDEKYNVQTYTLFRTRPDGALFEVWRGDVEGGAAGEVAWKFSDIGGGSLELLGTSGRLSRLRWDHDLWRLIPQRISVKALAVEKTPASGAGPSAAISPCAALLAQNDVKMRRFFHRCPNAKHLYDDARGEEEYLKANPQLGNQTKEMLEREPRDCQEVAGGYIGLRIRGISAPEDECRTADCAGEDCAQRISSLTIEKTLVVEVNGQRLEVNKRRVARRDSPAPAAKFELEDLSDGYSDPDDSRRIRLKPSSDFDGDGVPEIITEQDIHEHCDAPYSVVRIWKIKGRYLVPYSHVPKEEIREVKDIDQDGRIDLISRGAYEESRNECGIGEDIGPSIFVHHSLPDGTFSETDEVARAALRRFCPEKPAKLPSFTLQSNSKQDALVGAIICARAWKISAGELLQKLGKQCRAFSTDELACEEAGRKQGLCPAWLKKLVEVKPRVQLL